MIAGAARAELLRALARFLDAPDERVAGTLAGLLGLPAPAPWQHTRAFVELLVPYASVYLGAEGMIGGEARDRIAGFWRVLGETPPPEPDHLGTLLAAAARLAELESAATARAAAAYRRAREVLLREHVVSWVPLWLDKLRRVGPAVYRPWTELVQRTLAAELEALREDRDVAAAAAETLRAGGADAEIASAATASTGSAPPPCAQLGAVAPLPDPSDVGGECFLRALLAPARAGFILCRVDLRRCAEQLGVGLRVGERAFALRAMLGQDAAAVLGWLAEFADSEARAARRAGVDAFWWRRAHASAACLRAAAR